MTESGAYTLEHELPIGIVRENNTRMLFIKCGNRSCIAIMH